MERVTCKISGLRMDSLIIIYTRQSVPITRIIISDYSLLEESNYKSMVVYRILAHLSLEHASFSILPEASSFQQHLPKRSVFIATDRHKAFMTFSTFYMTHVLT